MELEFFAYPKIMKYIYIIAINAKKKYYLPNFINSTDLFTVLLTINGFQFYVVILFVIYQELVAPIIRVCIVF